MKRRLPPAIRHHTRNAVSVLLAAVLASSLAGCSAATRQSLPRPARSAVDDSRRDESAMLGAKGTERLQAGNRAEALDDFRAALSTLAGLDAPDLEYQWQWGSARALRGLGDSPRAISAYARAIGGLSKVRTRRRGDCRDDETRRLRTTATELHREYIDLLLEASPETDDQARLSTARDVAEAIKLDEVRDYFADECVDAAARQSIALDRVEPDAAVLYPIVLSDRFELILAVGGTLHRVRVEVAATELASDCARLRHLLELRTTRQYLPVAARLYDVVVRPVEALLQQHHIRTLVYVPSGPLMAVPPAAFHDGYQFLAARYAIALAPGLQLVDPRPFPHGKADALICAESTGAGGYAALPAVAREVSGLRQHARSTVLLDNAFTLKRVQTELEFRNYAILHMASHAYLGDSGGQSFFVAHGESISMDQLGAVVQTLSRRPEPLELLTLSACETASANDRSALGLAGLAIRAGAKSALASLWSVDDDATARLMDAFYGSLLTGDEQTPKARALQLAQQAMMRDVRYSHPAYWSAFVLVNNWR